MLAPIHQDPDKFADINTWCPLAPKLIGEKVFLTAFDDEYANELCRLFAEESTATGLGNPLYRTLTRREEREILENSSCNFDYGYYFLIWDIGDRKPIGTVSLMDPHPIDRRAELGVSIGSVEHRRGGRATEAISLVLDYAFVTLNLHSVRLGVFEYNDGAHECYKKLGFVETGRCREAHWVQGRYWDTIYMDILEREWFVMHPELLPADNAPVAAEITD